MSADTKENLCVDLQTNQEVVYTALPPTNKKRTPCIERMAKYVGVIIGMFFLLWLFSRVTGTTFGSKNHVLEDPAITAFRDYLRIKSEHPNPDYDGCIQWLKVQAQEIGLEFHHLKFQAPDLFAVWLTWPGSNPALKSILLNSHMDVVFANASNWIHDPYGAFKDKNGSIYGRGAQDMKSTTMERLEAIRKIKESGFTPLRTVHLAVMPDEELGGLHGMKPFVESHEFKNLNIGFDLDEGSASDVDVMDVVYGQKAAWQVKFTATGVMGHGASLVKGTAGEKIQVVISRLMKFRADQMKLMESNPGWGSEDVTSVNLVKLEGGVANNVLPPSLSAIFDIRIRIRPNWNFTDMENFLQETAAEAGSGVTMEFFQKSFDYKETPLDETNVWWMNLKATFDKMGWKYQPRFLHATTDARFVRIASIPALGLNPGLHVPSRIHQDNEFINEKTVLDAIERYIIIIRNLTQLSAKYP